MTVLTERSASKTGPEVDPILQEQLAIVTQVFQSMGVELPGPYFSPNRESRLLITPYDGSWYVLTQKGIPELRHFVVVPKGHIQPEWTMSSINASAEKYARASNDHALPVTRLENGCLSTTPNANIDLRILGNLIKSAATPITSGYIDEKELLFQTEYDPEHQAVTFQLKADVLFKMVPLPQYKGITCVLNPSSPEMTGTLFLVPTVSESRHQQDTNQAVLETI